MKRSRPPAAVARPEDLGSGFASVVRADCFCLQPAAASGITGRSEWASPKFSLSANRFHGRLRLTETVRYKDSSLVGCGDLPLADVNLAEAFEAP